MAKAGNAELVFVPLGGVGEIGMNFALYGFGPADAREWIVIDVGVTFPDASLPGVDLVLPDSRFIEEELKNLRGIVITHAHEDHYGALHDIWPRLKAPVWMTPFAAGLLEAKRQSEQGAPKIPVTVYRGGEKFTIGPFEIEAIPVPPSIPEPMSLAITTPPRPPSPTPARNIDTPPPLAPRTHHAR
jgi:ribonuclease J